MNRELSVCLLGCGRWGRHVLRDLLALGAEVHVVAQSAETHRAALTAGAKSAQRDLSSVPDDVTGYVVCTPSATHAEILFSLIATGKPIFVEKPMTTDVESARRLTREAGDRIFVMHKWRYHPGVIALADAVNVGEVGKVQALRSYRLGWGKLQRDVDALWYLAPHDLSIAQHVLGFVPKAQYAMQISHGSARQEFVGLLQDAPGGPAVMIDLGEAHPINRRSVVVIGTEGSAQLNGSYDDRVTLQFHRDGRSIERLIDAELPLLRELRAFLDYLRGGPPPMSSALEGLVIVERIAELRALAGIED